MLIMTGNHYRSAALKTPNSRLTPSKSFQKDLIRLIDTEVPPSEIRFSSHKVWFLCRSVAFSYATVSVLVERPGTLLAETVDAGHCVRMVASMDLASWDFCSTTLCMQGWIRWSISRPSHLQIPGGPKMACAALSRQAIDGPYVSLLK